MKVRWCSVRGRRAKKGAWAQPEHTVCFIHVTVMDIRTREISDCQVRRVEVVSLPSSAVSSSSHDRRVDPEGSQKLRTFVFNF